MKEAAQRGLDELEQSHEAELNSFDSNNGVAESTGKDVDAELYDFPTSSSSSSSSSRASGSKQASGICRSTRRGSEAVDTQSWQGVAKTSLGVSEEATDLIQTTSEMSANYQEAFEEVRRELSIEASERRNATDGLVGRLQHMEAAIKEEATMREEIGRRLSRDLVQSQARLQEEKALGEDSVSKLEQAMSLQADELERQRNTIKQLETKVAELEIAFGTYELAAEYSSPLPFAFGQLERQVHHLQQLQADLAI